MRTNLALRHASYGQTPLSYTTVHNRCQIYCHLDIQTGGTSVSNGTLNLLNHRIPSCLDYSLLSNFSGSVVNQLETPFFGVARSFAFSCSGLIFARSCSKMASLCSSLTFTMSLFECLSSSLSTYAVPS